MKMVKMYHLQIGELLLVHCNIVSDDYPQYSRLFYRFASNKSFFQLLDISPKIFISLKSFKSEF